ncbi:MAG: GNAT family N-acetyltransferase [Boseongicola sp.]|nr:GNAT family N-acetyltransferase [Boseongicola sp.]
MDNVKIRIDDDDTVVIANDNTTIGYATVDADARVLSYIFVNPAFRRQGYGTMLVEAAEKTVGAKLQPADPISPLGRKFFFGVA